mmetsp:Transcript_44513/g.141741  ORF Transcript_44513/g.141741 Transcript_44513/m.141741 type:complete len:412 (-) Transcript_44513:786-2021(-)
MAERRLRGLVELEHLEARHAVPRALRRLVVAPAERRAGLAVARGERRLARGAARGPEPRAGGDPGELLLGARVAPPAPRGGRVEGHQPRVVARGHHCVVHGARGAVHKVVCVRGQAGDERGRGGPGEDREVLALRARFPGQALLPVLEEGRARTLGLFLGGVGVGVVLEREPRAPLPHRRDAVAEAHSGVGREHGVLGEPRGGHAARVHHPRGRLHLHPLEYRAEVYNVLAVLVRAGARVGVIHDPVVAELPVAVGSGERESRELEPVGGLDEVAVGVHHDPVQAVFGVALHGDQQGERPACPRGHVAGEAPLLGGVALTHPPRVGGKARRRGAVAPPTVGVGAERGRHRGLSGDVRGGGGTPPAVAARRGDGGRSPRGGRSIARRLHGCGGCAPRNAPLGGEDAARGIDL